MTQPEITVAVDAAADDRQSRQDKLSAFDAVQEAGLVYLRGTTKARSRSRSRSRSPLRQKDTAVAAETGEHHHGNTLKPDDASAGIAAVHERPRSPM
ncbi:hypothetical protein HDU97_004249 [Phlyctochytrium planicorne]|nr:hypothetical protein HDU97_004249 [Phlyctochytrium planicorne]